MGTPHNYGGIWVSSVFGRIIILTRALITLWPRLLAPFVNRQFVTIFVVTGRCYVSFNETKWNVWYFNAKWAPKCCTFNSTIRPTMKSSYRLIWRRTIYNFSVFERLLVCVAQTMW